LDKQRETELTRALMDGHAGAFEEFVEHFRSKIFQYSWLMCGQREDAEEVAQETLLRVFESLSQLREPERVRPWVFRIAKNACLMKRRKSIFAPMQELSLDELVPPAGRDGEPRAFEIGDSSSLPEDELLRSELRVALHRAIAELPQTYRAVVLLRDLEELSTEETAQILDISPDAVKTRLHRGRLALRQNLGGYLRSAEAVG
jgi:RNA polymerase sigma-70 factor (ECF subfamily)